MALSQQSKIIFCMKVCSKPKSKQRKDFCAKNVLKNIDEINKQANFFSNFSIILLSFIFYIWSHYAHVNYAEETG